MEGRSWKFQWSGGIKLIILYIWHLQCWQKAHISNVFIPSGKFFIFFQTIINLLLLKSYYKFHFFWVRNVLVSFWHLTIWYDFAAWPIPVLILLSSDIETNPGPNLLWIKFFNLPLEFKQYFRPQFYQNLSSYCLRSGP